MKVYTQSAMLAVMRTIGERLNAGEGTLDLDRTAIRVPLVKPFSELGTGPRTTAIPIRLLVPAVAAALGMNMQFIEVEQERTEEPSGHYVAGQCTECGRINSHDSDCTQTGGVA